MWRCKRGVEALRAQESSVREETFPEMKAFVAGARDTAAKPRVLSKSPPSQDRHGAAQAYRGVQLKGVFRVKEQPG